MVTKKTEGPAWFKVFTCNLSVIEACPPEDLGNGFLAACRLLRQDEPDLDKLSAPARMIFGCLREGIEESIDSYELTVLRNRRISANRKKSTNSPDSPTGTTWNHVEPPRYENTPETETETETEADTETQSETQTENLSPVDPFAETERLKTEQLRKLQDYLLSSGKSRPCT